MLTRWLNWTLIGLNGLILTVFVVTTWNDAPSLSGWDYKDVVSLLLTIMTAVLAALAILLALGAFWSYEKIAEHASSKAIKAVDDFLISDVFYERVGAIVSERIQASMQEYLSSRIVPSNADDRAIDPPAGETPWAE